ncbi:HSP90 family protein [Corynebacterium kozikiae]|uniref:HSP90 family protein n=1 Tax=Corynebacterium kozikiae TaxID=2968469 RepID=UPI00211C82C3|nr:HSP90 family protein [Corynebacterium sp. 76QC2CO]MCQ9344152.1 HSP90 family protein [Corynebacterium sp. 76QC2CO]
MDSPQQFHVDLGGMVSLLSRNLYSGPRVFVRELLQNGIDAITARREEDPDCPAQINIELLSTHPSGVLDLVRFSDTGKGITLEESRELLATIGASSKRDEFGFHRSDYLGQFGIGLLSALMVSPSIVVYSRSIDALDQPIRWEGNSNGTWTTRPVQPHELPEVLQTGPGTTVELRRTDFDFGRIPGLVDYYGRYLPAEIVINGEPLESEQPPWLQDEEGQQRWCEQHFGFTPFACVPLNDILSGARGVAYIIPSGAHPGQHVKHTVYLHGMMLGDRISDLLPEWAYFARVVVDVEHLRPTASREALANDEALAETRESFGSQIRQWLQSLAELVPHQFAEFVSLHLAGLKSLALVDEPTRRLVARTVPVPTTLGPMTLDEVIGLKNGIRFTRTTKAFEAIAAVAQAREVLVVNAGYAFDEEILDLLRLDYPDILIEELSATSLLDDLELPTHTQRIHLMPVVHASEQALEGEDVEVVLRRFSPEDLPAVYLPQPDSAGRRIEQRVREEDEQIDALMSLLESRPQKRPGSGNGNQPPNSLGAEAEMPQLVLNADSPVIAQLADLQRVSSRNTPGNRLDADSTGQELLVAGIRALYVQALISAHQELGPKARRWSVSLLSTLIAHAL